MIWALLLVVLGIIGLAVRFRGTGDTLPSAVFQVTEAVVLVGAILFACYVPIHFIVKFW